MRLDVYLASHKIQTLKKFGNYGKREIGNDIP
jgi:hypothetical protein